MAKTYTITLTDEQEQLLAWHTAQINETRAKRNEQLPIEAKTVDNLLAPVTEDDVFYLAVTAQFEAKRDDFQRWKAEKRVAALKLADAKTVADIDAKLGLSL